MNQQNLMNYLTSLNKLPLQNLMDLLNEDSSDNRLIRILTTSTVIVHKYINYFDSRLHNIELKLSAVLTILHLRYIDNKTITIQDINKLVKKELNIISNMVFQGVSNWQIDSYVNPIGLDNLIIKELRNEVIKRTPNRLKLVMYMYLKTNEMLIDNYPDIDKFLFYKILEQSGYIMDSKLKLNIELPTLSEKALFLFLLSNEYPDLFVILSSVNNINTLILLSELDFFEKYNTGKLIEVFDSTATSVNKLASSNTMSQEEINLFASLAKKVDFGSSVVTISDLLMSATDRIYDEFDSSLEVVSKRAKNTSNITALNSTLNTEILKQLSIVNKLHKVVS